jgi:hypothetical protein
LIDKAKFAVIVTCPDSVEHCTIDPNPERLPFGLANGNLSTNPRRAALNDQLHLGSIHKLLVFNDVQGLNPVDRNEDVSNHKACAVGR